MEFMFWRKKERSQEATRRAATHLSMTGVGRSVELSAATVVLWWFLKLETDKIFFEEVEAHRQQV